MPIIVVNGWTIDADAIDPHFCLTCGEAEANCRCATCKPASLLVHIARLLHAAAAARGTTLWAHAVSPRNIPSPPLTQDGCGALAGAPQSDGMLRHDADSLPRQSPPDEA